MAEFINEINVNLPEFINEINERKDLTSVMLTFILSLLNFENNIIKIDVWKSKNNKLVINVLNERELRSIKKEK